MKRPVALPARRWRCEQKNQPQRQLGAHPDDGCAACSWWNTVRVRAIHLSSACGSTLPGSRPDASAGAAAVRSGISVTLLDMAAKAWRLRLIGGCGRCVDLPQLWHLDRRTPPALLRPDTLYHPAVLKETDDSPSGGGGGGVGGM